MLGRRYGTRPPQAYYDEMARDPGAFRFIRGRAGRMAAPRPAPADARLAPGALAVRPPRDGPLLGTFSVPVVFGLFSDSPDAADMLYGADTVLADYFGEQEGSVRSYYDEVSGGRMTFIGDVYDWVRATSTQQQVTGGVSGLASGLTGPFIKQILDGLPGVDWGPYDNDGPDGVPNSGDDDGYVDALAVIHPTSGAECQGFGQDDKIWSHKWNLLNAAGGAFVTPTPSLSPLRPFIEIEDYFIQPIFGCDGNSLSQIGVFTHESGHAFGLPDLYDTSSQDGNTAGAGNWDLMASGSWGCSNNDPARPCHMGAWSKDFLGWVDVRVLAPDTAYGVLTLPPVETSGQVFRVGAGDGSGEYFLLENRQAIGFDSDVYQEGLLVWQIDPDWVEDNWQFNEVNAFAHQGVWIRQADGLDELGQPGGGRGDAGDPFPFEDPTFGNDVFHAASDPASRSYDAAEGAEGTATGLTILDIARVGDDVQFSLLTRFTDVSLSTEGDEGNGGLFTVDDTPVVGTTYTYTAAPFEPHVIEAAAGDVVAEGIRRRFEGWKDDAEARRKRPFTTPVDDVSLVALYGGRQIELSLEITGAQGDIGPGTVTTTPISSDLWFAEGTAVTLQANPDHSFGFVEWTGDLAGRPNPTMFTLAAPIQAGATFELTYMVATATVDIAASEDQELDLQVEDGTAPFFWRLVDGAFPLGLEMDDEGHVTGASLEIGTFPVTVDVVDGVSLRVEGLVTFEVASPDIPISQFASPFLLVGEPVTLSQRLFFDYQGNRDGGYDLGDVRAWVLANPGLPFTANLRASAGPRTIVLRRVVPAPGSER